MEASINHHLIYPTPCAKMCKMYTHAHREEGYLELYIVVVVDQRRNRICVSAIVVMNYLLTVIRLHALYASNPAPGSMSLPKPSAFRLQGQPRINIIIMVIIINSYLTPLQRNSSWLQLFPVSFAANVMTPTGPQVQLPLSQRFASHGWYYFGLAPVPVDLHNAT